MLQRFKLRLGDGTVLLVDHDGLGTWLVDGKAAVQAGKFRNWVPLRKFLASERASAARRARSEAAAWASLPADSPPARRGDGLPLVPPHSAEAETPSPALTPPPGNDGLPLVSPPSTPAERPLPELTPPPREDGLPLVPPPPPRGAAPGPELAAPPGEDELSLVIPVPRQDASPSVQSAVPIGDGSRDWAPLAEEGSVPSPLIEPEAMMPVGERLEEKGPAPGTAALRPEDDPIIRITVGEPRVVQVPAEEPPAAGDEGRLEWPLEKELVAVAAEAVTTLERSNTSPGPGGTELTLPGHPGEPHEVQALAEDPVSSQAGSVSVTDLPVIPFKPLEEDAPVPPAPLPAASGGTFDGAAAVSREPRSAVAGPAGSEHRTAPPDGRGSLDETQWRPGSGVSAHRLLVSFGAFLSRCIDPINRLERGLPPFPGEGSGAGVVKHRAPRGAPMAALRAQEEIPRVRPLAEEPSLVGEHDQGSSKTSDGPSVIRLKPLDGDEAPFWDPSKGRRLLARARAWVDRPATWIARRTARDRPEVPAEPERHREAEPAPREALQAPPAIAELPVLRFATANEPAVVEHVYGGDETESLAPVAWLWTKRLALAAALLAGATLAVLTFEAWSPRAAKIGEATLSEIDGRVRSHHLAGQRKKAVAEVADELPQLDPDTIGALMAASPTGLLDAAGVFEMARDATDRGAVALSADDARDLEAVQRELFDGLLPAERERLQEFDLARARGAVFPLDGKQALLVYARGARQLPPVSQERLRLLLGRAIAAALAPPTQATTSGVGAR